MEKGSAMGSRDAVMDDYGGVVRKAPKTGMSRGKKVGIIVAILLVVAIAVGVGAGVGVSNANKNKKSNTNPSTSSNSTSGTGIGSGNGTGTGAGTGAGTGTGTGSNVTAIVPNAAFHRTFWGLDYNSNGSLYNQGCGVTQDDVNKDLAFLYQLTPRVRLYGMDCNQTRYVFEGMRQMNIQMGITVTIYLSNDTEVVARQLGEFWSVTQTYGFDNIVAVSMGNEALYGNLLTLDQLDTFVQQMKANLTALGQNIPVTTSDATTFAKVLLPIVDFLAENDHPFFGDVLATNASNWTLGYFQTTQVEPAAAIGKGAVISETGWPTQGTNAKGDAPSVASLNLFLNEFICAANQIPAPYYWFELRDEPAKNFNDHEPYWGILDEFGNLKPGLTLPDCGGQDLPLWTGKRDGKGS